MKISPPDTLGMQFDTLGYPPAKYSEELRNRHLEEGTSPDWAIKLHDNSMQFLLTESRSIKTVFILSQELISDFLGMQPSLATVKSVVAKLGKPSRLGEEAHLGVLGIKGPWLRYDDPNKAVHFEFRPGGRGIHMVTLMVPEHAP